MAGRLSAYRKLFEGLTPAGIRPLYFIHGTEEHMKREFTRKLIEVALPEGERTFNLDILHGDEFDPQGFDDRLQAFPLFAARRVVILRGFDALSPSNRDRVAERAESTPEGLTLVVESASEKLETAAHKRMAATAGRRGVEFAFTALDEAETLERVLARCKREGFQVEPEALDLLIESVGTQMIDLSNEVDKILLAAADERRITRDVVASVVGKYRTESLFSLLDGLASSPPATTLARFSSLVDAGEEPVFLVAMLLRRVVSLLEVQRVVSERGRVSERTLAESLASTSSPYFATRLREQVAKTSPQVLETTLRNLRWADLKLKSTSLHSRTVVEEALVASHVGKSLATPQPSP